MAKQTFDPVCPRCGADREIVGAYQVPHRYVCGSYYTPKDEFRRIGIKWDGRLRVGPNCDPKRKGKEHG